MISNLNHTIPTQPGSAFSSFIRRQAKSIIISLLRQLRRDRLRIITPDGESLVFGQAQPSESIFKETPTIEIFNDEFFERCLLYADLGLAESYLDGLCQISSIRDVISWFLINTDNSPVMTESKKSGIAFNLLGAFNRLAHVARNNSVKNSRINIYEHYDLGNNFFNKILDPSMTYSSALFESGNQDLETAQYAKFDRICKKLRLNSKDHVLEIGCGWGAFAVHAASKYGCRITGITISEAQLEYAQRRVRAAGLEDRIDLKLLDYRDLKGSFDKVVSIEMIEAVGDEYMDKYISTIDSVLKPHGLVLLQMITCPDSRYETLKRNVDFIQKHIFPGSLLPSLRRVSGAMQKCGDLFPIDVFDMTDSYVATLKLWDRNFNREWQHIKAMGFDDKFKRKWNYYFEYCQAAFHMRNISVVQSLYSRPNNYELSSELVE